MLFVANMPFAGNIGELNFMEFVMTMWYFLCLTDENISELAFLLQDPSGKKSLGSKKGNTIYTLVTF